MFVQYEAGRAGMRAVREEGICTVCGFGGGCFVLESTGGLVCSVTCAEQVIKRGG